MKIAYVTTYDASDVHAWSGLGNYILRSLADSGLQITCIGNLRRQPLPLCLSIIKKLYYTKLRSKTYIRDREPSLLKDYSTQVEKSLRFTDHDVVFSPGTVPIAYLQNEKPIAYWTDSTFAGMKDFYPNFSNLCRETIAHGNEMEQTALSNCRLAIYSSEWAANTVIQNYNVDPAKIKVVPFGANISCSRDINEIRRIVENKKFDVCKLLFMGVEWYRKGGDIALEVANLLNERGLKTELHIVGCDPPIALPSFVKNHGFISKKTEEGRRKIDQLLSEVHFLILPSRAECFGIVFAEASSFGLPSLATKIGGIPTAIHDNRNGWTFALDESPDRYCDLIQNFMASKDKYHQLALSSFQEYSERLNWSSSGKKVHDLLQEYCS